ncbi:uncharacterized protein LOC132562742 [Ylistrum balloti]|uniref:uncharacterized protein LOC132562742 n=1 Tax=Ylistrum balloti TaxID=509963 RepID=UPI002905DB79|nr:uncharacterized protein LOC132562742 [Ylistrum balloti]
MHKRVHPHQGKRISKNEIRQIEFDDGNEERIRHVSKSSVSFHIQVEEQRSKSTSFFKPKWMRSSDEGQKVSRMVKIKRWLLKSTLPKHHKKKSNIILKEQLNAIDYDGVDNPGFVNDEIEEEEVEPCVFQLSKFLYTENICPESQINDMPLIELKTVDLIENDTSIGQTSDGNFPHLGAVCPVQDICPWTGNANTVQLQMFSMVIPNLTRSVLPMLDINQCSGFSGIYNDRENENNYVTNHIQHIVVIKSTTQRLIRQEKRNHVLRRRLMEMTTTLVKQSKTINRQNKCIDMLSDKVSCLTSKLKKNKEKRAVVNQHIHVENVESFEMSLGRNN